MRHVSHEHSVWNLLSEFDRALGPVTREYHPVVEVNENESEFVLSVDLPGVAEENARIEVDQGRLRISGERPNRGAFDRQFTLPKGIDEERIRAQFKHGVLEVTVPKSEAPKPRTIAISAPVSSH